MHRPGAPGRCRWNRRHGVGVPERGNGGYHAERWSSLAHRDPAADHPVALAFRLPELRGAPKTFRRTLPPALAGVRWSRYPVPGQRARRARIAAENSSKSVEHRSATRLATVKHREVSMRILLYPAVLGIALFTNAAAADVLEEFRAEDWNGMAFADDQSGKLAN